MPHRPVEHPPGPGADVLDVVALGPGVLAGFSTRDGGVSADVWHGLNVGSAVGDDPDAVARNRALLADRVGAPVLFTTQVHGADVVRVGTHDAADVSGRRADALVTTRDDVALGVYVADCAPVLLVDPVAHVAAAAHAGRPGLVAGVLQATVAAMVELGADPARTRAVVGPCIAAASYEVPEEMRDAVVAAVPQAGGRTTAGTPAVDLAAGARAVLAACGVGEVAVDPRDTYRDARLYSHRRAVHARARATGRFAGVVRLLPAGGGRPVDGPTGTSG